MPRLFLCLVIGFVLSACSDDDAHRQEVVIYTSVDRTYAEPVFDDLARETGLTVLAVYDVEAAKTSGLVNRLLAEAGRPRADLFWNGELLQTQVLKDHGVLAPYPLQSPTDARRGDPDGYWVSFGGRARVLLLNTARLKDGHRPSAIADLVAPEWPGERIAVAYPLFGTSATHAVALYVHLGTANARRFYASLVERNVRIVDGNSVVRDLVVGGDVDIGLTDSDDACAAVAGHPHLAAVFPDQGDGDGGTLVIPNSVALIAGGPHPDAAKVAMDYLLSETVARRLAASGWFHVDGERVLAPHDCGLPSTVKAMPLDVAALASRMREVLTDLKPLVVR